jgi:hypothetical protein
LELPLLPNPIIGENQTPTAFSSFFLSPELPLYFSVLQGLSPADAVHRNLVTASTLHRVAAPPHLHTTTHLG